MEVKAGPEPVPDLEFSFGTLSAISAAIITSAASRSMDAEQLLCL